MKRRERNRALKIRLDAWGSRLNRPVPGLGYSGRTAEAVLMEYGGMFRSTQVTPITPKYNPNPAAAEVHRAVNELGNDLQKAVYARHALVVKHYEIREVCGCPPRTHYERLERAYAFLAGRLGYDYEG